MKTSKWLQRLSCLALMLAFSAGCSKVQQLAETVAQESLSIVTTSLAPAVINKFYGDNLTASGGAYPYTFALVAGSLPPGLAMSEQGAITGTPTSLGNYSMTVQVTDSAGATSTSTFGITVTSEITITTPSLPPATTGVAYAYSIAVTGGSGTYSFGATGLPAGFSISASTGIISGSSASSSSNTVLITVTDSNGLQDSKSYNFAVASPPVISPAPLAAAGAGAAYNVTLNVTGGIAAYTWALDSGSLPAGLSLSTAGVISGTPSFGVNVANSPHSFTVRVTDSLGQTDLQAYALTVAIRPAAVEDARRMLRVARVGVAYTDYVPVEGGVGAKAFAATGLPTGLTISATSGFISGTPAGAAGDYPVNITVTDSLGIAASVTKNMRLVNAGMTNIGYSAPIMNPIGLNNSQWSYPTDIDVKDLNADGNLDVVWGALDARGIVVMLGDGQGNFTKYFYANAGAARSRFVKIANMNADGIWDVVTMTADSRIEVYLGNAAGWTNAPVTRSYNVAVDTWGFDIGDMNGDGAEDIVFASWAGNVRALYNCGAAANVNLPAPTACNMANAPLNMYNVAITALSQPRDLVLHNFDGAGGLDIIATSYNTASVQITLGVGNGTYGTPYTAATGATGPRGLVKADMNQDGRMDVVATGDTGISVMLNTAGIAPNNVTLNATSYSIADLGAASEYIDAADINGDGFPDIALAVAGLHQNSVALFMNNGAGDLVNREVWSSVGYQTIGVRFGSVLATSVALSLPDLITTVGSWIGPSRSLVYPNSGNPAKPYNPGLFNFNTNPVSSVNVHGASRVGDLNEDGFNDVIFKVGGAANILLGKADRTFDLSTEAFPTGDISAQWWHGHQLAVADLNGDRHVDLISGNWNGGGLGTVTVLLGVGNGTFGSQYSFSVEQPGCTANLGVRAVDTGDFNRDGKMDILVGVGCTSMNLPRAYVYFGNGDGTFRTATIDRREVSGSNQSVYLVAAVDVNKDGTTDIVTVSNDSRMHQYTNDGTGTFTAFGTNTFSLASQNLSNLAVGDLDGNGYLDYVISSNGSSNLGRQLSMGTGTITGASVSIFQGANGDYTGHPHNGMVLIDYDEDGALDIVTLRRFADINPANRVGGGGIHFHRNNGAGTFTAFSRVLAPAVPGPYMEGMLTTGDMNGDGRLDIVSTNAYNGAGSGIGVNMCTSN